MSQFDDKVYPTKSNTVPALETKAPAIPRLVPRQSQQIENTPIIRLPHWNEEAEKVILGTAIQNSSAFPEIQRLLRPRALYDERHRKVFDACAKLRSENVPIDTIQIRMEIEHAGVALAAEDIVYLERLTDYASSVDALKYYINLIHQAELKRQLNQLSSETQTQIHANGINPQNLLFEIQAKVSELVELDRSSNGGSHFPVFRSAAEIMKDSAPEEIIEGIAYKKKVTVLVSESGTGKTFALLGMGAAVSSDTSWLGRLVKHGSVAYVSFEGDALGLRCRAIKEAQGHRLENFYFLQADSPLSPIIDYERGETPSAGTMLVKAQLRELAASLAADGKPPIRLLIIDMIRASMTGSEDNSENVAAYLRTVRQILAQLPEAGCILAHHTGWQDGDRKRKRERGSSAFRGNVDQTVHLAIDSEDPQRGEVILTLTSEKMRDVEKLPPLYCIRRRVTLNESDARGEPRTSCVIEEDLLSPSERENQNSKAAEAENLALDLKILGFIAENPEVATSYDQIRIGTALNRNIVAEAVIRLTQRRWLQTPDRQRKPYRVTSDGLTALKGSSERVERVVPSSTDQYRVVSSSTDANRTGAMSMYIKDLTTSSTE